MEVSSFLASPSQSSPNPPSPVTIPKYPWSTSLSGARQLWQTSNDPSFFTPPTQVSSKYTKKKGGRQSQPFSHTVLPPCYDALRPPYTLKLDPA
ncbi:NADH-ubiquinone oxidoreductase 14.8 kDa subunit [Fusarium oxysporum f. sp. albedinis]|nr:NADH-ubiquinone oxidoreductase 14.8 kDa subunit [Fusarium oxysporum f. sp. albedinis]